MAAQPAYIVSALFVHGTDRERSLIHGPATGVSISPPTLPTKGTAKMLLAIASEAAGTHVARITFRSPSGARREIGRVPIPIAETEPGLPRRSWLGLREVNVVWDVDEWGLYWFEIDLGEQHTEVALEVNPAER